MIKTVFDFKLKFNERIVGKTFFKRLLNLFKGRTYQQRNCGGSCGKIFKKINWIDIYLPSFLYSFERYKFTFNDKPIRYDELTKGIKENILIRDISYVITHEYIHLVLNNIDTKLTRKQHHYGTGKLGF